MLRRRDRDDQEPALPEATPTESEIRDWCVTYLRRTIDNPAIAIGPDIPFPQMGLDSASSAHFIVELEEWAGTELDPEIVFEHRTIAELARYVAGRQGGTGAG